LSLEEFDLVAVAMDTGLRRAKLFGLAWIDVDLERGWITIKKAKAGSSRQVPFTNRVREILTRRHAQKKSHFVFPNSTGEKPMDSNNFINRVFKPALERAGIEDFKWHDLRRTFASRLASAGKGGRVLTELLGHKSTKTTDRYAHLDPDTFRAAVDVLNDDDQGKGGLRVVK
jgi:integrase